MTSGTAANAGSKEPYPVVARARVTAGPAPCTGRVRVIDRWKDDGAGGDARRWDTGVTAAAAALFGARLSRLPAFGHLSAVYPGSAGARGSAVTVWVWPVQPGAQPGAWAAALGAFAVGGALFVVRGARAEGPRG
ncbi:hypothetical protein OHB00_18150 [Streptomyces sp. NBC_00631]|uniref:hypothetical protein n=1 Tax=Streptomyces sp. NBC_00631 TaxID=2975793 RepID=UPI0030E162AE